MSVRAYKVEKIVKKAFETFNISQDTEVVERLALHQHLNDDGYGLAEVRRCEVESALADNPSDDAKAIYEQILKDMDGKDDIRYWCY